MRERMKCGAWRRRAGGLARVAAAAACGLGTPNLIAAQACIEPVGFLGISELECADGCSLHLMGDGRGGLWSFSVEPSIVAILPGSPAARALAPGDQLISIDGMPITSPEAGHVFANMAPGQTLALRYRRNGRETEVSVSAEGRCGPWVEGVPATPTLEGALGMIGALGPSSPSWGALTIALDISLARDGWRTAVSVPEPRSPGDASSPMFAEASMGMSFSCGPCSTTQHGTERIWTFSNPILVTAVDQGGPAEIAGIRLGDHITHVAGVPIESPAGGEAFSRVRRGHEVELTVVRREGQPRVLKFKLFREPRPGSQW